LRGRPTEMVFPTRITLYGSLSLKHNRGAGRPEPSRKGEGSLTPLGGPGVGPILV
jgi:hypothetical protein